MKIKKFQPILALKPSQFAVGLLEVEYKVSDMKKLAPAKLTKLIRKTLVPVVISPWGELCIVDHHHYLFACWHAGVNRVAVKVIKNFSQEKMSYLQFWRRMAALNYAYLYDQFGDGPRSPLYLPMDVRGLADDPYRSLAWMVRKEGGYINSDVTFAEFRWADFFRKYKLLDRQGRKAFHVAIAKGVKLAISLKAKKLPGHIKAKRKTKVILQKEIIKSEFVLPKQKKGPHANKVIIKSKE